MTDSLPLFSAKHEPDPDWTTRIQIGRKRFYTLERIIDTVRLFIFRPKISKEALEKMKYDR